MKTISFAIFCLISGGTVTAGQRTSTNYSIAAETADAGGRRAASANYTNVGSATAVAGVSAVVAPVQTAKHGYIGQLFDVTGLALNAATTNANEGTTLQLGAWQSLDDATFLAVPAASVSWSVQSGPLTGIDANGLASAGLVYQNTAASAQGSYLGNEGFLGLTVINIADDDFGAYAGDGIADNWQVQYFGLDNPLAAPALDPDGDGLANRIEYILGSNPVSSSPVEAAHPALTVSGENLLFTFTRADSSEASGVTLAVESSTNLVNWPDVFTIGPDTLTSSPGVTIVENGTAPDTITVVIPAGSGKARFARLKVTIPP